MLKEKMKGFLIGAITTAVLVCGYSAFSETIDKVLTATFKDIKIIINGYELTPTDVNGNPVEPFVIDGTTYLPVRAISEAVGYDVDWDYDTNTVILSSYTDDPEYGWVSFVDLFTYADAEYLVNFDKIVDESNQPIHLILSLIEDGRGTDLPSKIRMHAYSEPIGVDFDEYDIIFEDYVAETGDNTFVYYDEETETEIIFVLDIYGDIVAEQYSGKPLGINGVYSFSSVG